MNKAWGGGGEGNKNYLMTLIHRFLKNSNHTLIKLFSSEKNLKKMFRQARVDKITEKEFEPITKRPDKLEKAVRQTDEDLIKKLELMPKYTRKVKEFESVQ
jgi:hypothetical protein